MVLIPVALSSGREDYTQQPIAGKIRHVGTGIKEQLIGSAVVAVIADLAEALQRQAHFDEAEQPARRSLALWEEALPDQ